MRRSSVPLAALALVALAACGAAEEARRATVSPRAAPPTGESASRPARWVYTDRVGAIFDPAIPAPTLPGSEPALIEGTRVIVTDGIVDATARADDRFLGFRRLPARLGGGYAIWSASRTYRAATFLGDLTPIADVAASGGVRPWLHSLLLRTGVGNVLVDPTTLAVERADLVGTADAVAIDDQRAARLDRLGRASVTIDGGATWTDVLATRGVLVDSLVEREDGGITLTSAVRSGQAILLDSRGRLGAPPPAPPLAAKPTSASLLPLATFPTSSRALPDDTIEHAVVVGAELPGDRLLVAREGGLRILSARTALPVDEGDLVHVDKRFARCQPFTGAASTPLLVCAGELGAEVLSLASPLGSSRLEATFPDQGLFVAGPRERLGFTGRCGPFPPSSGDLGAGTPPEGDPTDDVQAGLIAPPEPVEIASRVEPMRADEARYCARISADSWVERRLGGDDARALYRFVPGDEGRVTALVLRDGALADKAPRPSTPPPIDEGVRVIRLDPADPALGGAAFPAVPALPKEEPYRSIDDDFWEDDDGAIRGWVRLPGSGDPPTLPDPIEQGPARRKLRVVPGRGGLRAGVRIDGGGRIQVLPLPDGVTDVVSGGRFGLAQGTKDGAVTTWETTDGGLRWAVIAGPPTGHLAPPPDDTSPFGCSAIGCTWGAGVARLGWGGAPPLPVAPAPEATPPLPSPALRDAPPRQVACRFDTDGSVWGAEQASPALVAPRAPRAASPSARPPALPSRAPSRRGTAPQLRSPISLRLGTSAEIGQLEGDGAWSGDVWLPFQPASAPRHLSARDRSLTTAHGAVIPLLAASPREPWDLLLSVGKRRLRAFGATPALQAFDIAATITIAADGPEGELVLFSPHDAVVWIARGEAVSAAVRLHQVADVSRTTFTLGRRIPGGGLVIVGYSTVTGEVFGGDLDLVRAEVGPLFALGGLTTLEGSGAPGCASQEAAIRFLAELPTHLTLQGKASAPLQQQDGLAMFSIEASPARLCATGVEVGRARSRAVDLTARFGRGAGAAVRTLERRLDGSCTIERP